MVIDKGRCLLYTNNILGVSACGNQHITAPSWSCGHFVTLIRPRRWKLIFSLSRATSSLFRNWGFWQSIFHRMIISHTIPYFSNQLFHLTRFSLIPLPLSSVSLSPFLRLATNVVYDPDNRSNISRRQARRHCLRTCSQCCPSWINLFLWFRVHDPHCTATTPAQHCEP